MKKLLLLALVAATAWMVSGALSPAHAQEWDKGSPLQDLTLDRMIVPAPIESVEVVPSGSTPTGHALSIVAGLPSGCAQPHDYGFYRFGRFIYAYVLNTVPADPNVVCTLQYGLYDVTIDLGSDFVPGETYYAVVNTTPISFEAHGGIVPPEDTFEDPEERVIVEAPIESVEILTLESYPPQFTAHIVAGLPSGCAEADDYEVSQSGNEITIEVTNSMPPGDPICTMIYGTYEFNVNLGSDFEEGETYTVNVNGTIATFTP